MLRQRRPSRTLHQTSESSIHNASEKSLSATPPAREQSEPLNHSSAVTFESDDSSMRPSPPEIAIGVRLYFQYCHRQPIWCFDREDVHDCSSIPEELACSILALTSRFLDNRSQLQFHGETAKTLVMLRIANGTVGLGTIESLCLLSYSCFIGMFKSWLACTVPCVTRSLAYHHHHVTKMATIILASSILALPFRSAARRC